MLNTIFFQAPLVTPVNYSEKDNFCTICEAKLDAKATLYRHNDR